jgi:hypothetical protein
MVPVSAKVGFMTWLELMLLIVYGPGGTGGPDPAVRGVLRELRRAPAGWSIGDPFPDEAAALRVWQQGRAVRVESAEGIPLLVGDADTAWDFRDDPARPWKGPREPLWLHREAVGPLLVRRDAHTFVSDDFTHPDGPPEATTYLGRPAWAVTLLPPPHKPFPAREVLDAETGRLLVHHVAEARYAHGWSEFVTGEELDPALFGWDGPVRDEADRVARDLAADRRKHQRRSSWFRTHVGPTDLSVQVPLAVDLSLQYVHEYKPKSGAFHVSLGDPPMATLARRPRSDTPWRGFTDVHRWSCDQYDWALDFYDLEPDPATLEAVKNAFREPSPAR